jgi:hypothetical protein
MIAPFSMIIVEWRGLAIFFSNALPGEPQPAPCV